eukprot:TRINITY_DN51_c0_g1_i2.p1 TRINITY_DN51_c0_g1~~TRINITY_DN51_c0_g1_i2.p1  ORF type:complete len:228 (+),score=55.22 TRINITY_DN51_c0_g1_i2:82-765(+)
MKVLIKDPIAQQFFVEVEKSDSIDQVKQLISKQFPSPQSQKLLFNGKLLINGTVEENGLHEGDSVLLVLGRNPLPQPPLDDTPAPTKRSILAATSSKPLPPENAPAGKSVSGLRDLMNTLWSGISGASGVSPAPTGNQPTQPEVNPEALQKLVDMGFPEERCKKALLLNRMNPNLAMEWLLEHHEDPDVDTPLPSSPSTTGPPAPFYSRPCGLAATRGHGISQGRIH